MHINNVETSTFKLGVWSSSVAWGQGVATNPPVLRKLVSEKVQICNKISISRRRGEFIFPTKLKRFKNCRQTNVRNILLEKNFFNDFLDFNMLEVKFSCIECRN